MRKPGAFSPGKCEAGAIIALVTIALSGCSTADPTAGSPAYVPSAVDARDNSLPQGPINTGTYPNINDEPLPSADQLSAGETASLTSQMRQLVADQNAGRISASTYAQRLAYLRRLARRHSPEMLQRIDAQARAASGN